MATGPRTGVKASASAPFRAGEVKNERRGHAGTFDLREHGGTSAPDPRR
jgi:hypothetical protein